MKTLSILTFVTYLTLGFVGCCCCGGDYGDYFDDFEDIGGGGTEEWEETTAPPETPADTLPETAGNVTLANFNRVQTGMTYNEIVGIFGSPGELMSETSMAGYTTKVYTWTARDGFSNCVITLQNDAVMSKSQFGLP